MKAFVRNTAIFVTLFGIFVACSKKSSSDKSKEEKQEAIPAATAAPAPALKPQETAAPALLDGTWQLTDVYCMDTGRIVTNGLGYYFQSLKIDGTSVLANAEFTNNVSPRNPSLCEYEFSLVASTPDNKIVIGSEKGKLATVSAGGSCRLDQVVERESFFIEALAAKTLTLKLPVKRTTYAAADGGYPECDFLKYRYVR